MSTPENRRILLIDDNESIHADIKKILTPKQEPETNLADMRAAFLGGGAEAEASESTPESIISFEIHSALQGKEGYELLCEACDADEPFAVAFVDMRMPPGWDGVQTIKKLWERDPDLQVVVCTAFSDYTWEETVAELGQSDRLLILKKPFDSIEIYQLAAALSEKWNVTRREHSLMDDLKRAEAEARSYASSLETVNRSLVTAKAAADMAAEMKTEFLVRLTGEMNCRLAEVLGSAEFLAAPEGASEEVREHAETVVDIGRHLLQTVNEILDVTTLESGDTELAVDACKPIALVRDVLDEFAEAADQKGLELKLEESDALPEVIETEERHLRKLLQTLVDNAIRYTDSGQVSLKVSLESTESWQRPKLTFEVSDTGRGIERERLGKLFEPCPREDEAAGYGFGLALAKRLSALLGGGLCVRSEPGEGTTFVLTVEAPSSSTARAA